MLTDSLFFAAVQQSVKKRLRFERERTSMAADTIARKGDATIGDGVGGPRRSFPCVC
jgi:hypothetical protein